MFFSGVQGAQCIWGEHGPLKVPLSFADNNLYLTVDNSTMFLCMGTIFYCQIVLCYETRRHKKEIVAQQVSLETREILKGEKSF